MKKILTLAVLICFTSFLRAQTTTVSATVVDSDSTSWTNGSWNITFQPNMSVDPNPQDYNINGTPLSPSVTHQSGAISGSATFSLSVYQNSTISPAGSSWNLNICPNAVTACGFYNFQAVGSSMNLSSVLTSIIPAPRFIAASGTYGYSDGEASLQLRPGNTYWNVVSLEQRWWNGAAWITWSGGGSGCITTTAGFAQFADGSGGCLSEFIDSEITYGNALTIQPSPGDGIVIDSSIGLTHSSGTIIQGKNEDDAIDINADGQQNIDATTISFCGYNGASSGVGSGHCPNGNQTTHNIYGEVNSISSGLGTAEFWTNGGLELSNTDGGSGFFESFPLPLNFADSPVTLDYSGYFEPVDATGGNVVINLDQICPVPNNFCNDGLMYLFTKEDSSANTITIVPYGAQTIAGSSSYTLTTQFQAVELIADYTGNVGGTPTWVIKNQSGGGGGAVISVSNSDGSLNISPTTGTVVGSLNTANHNIWTGNQDHTGTTDVWQVMSPSNPDVGINNTGLTASDGTGDSILYNSHGVTASSGGSTSDCWNTAGSTTACNSGGGSGVSSFNTRTGSVSLLTADVNAVGAITNNTSGTAAHATALASSPTTCSSGQLSTGIAANGNAICVGIATIQIALSTSLLSANTCTSPSTVTMTGLVAPSGSTPGSVFSTSYESDPSSITGWGSSGGLSLKLWASSTNTLSWEVCNATGSSITPGALKVDVGAK